MSSCQFVFGGPLFRDFWGKEVSDIIEEDKKTCSGVIGVNGNENSRERRDKLVLGLSLID